MPTGTVSEPTTALAARLRDYRLEYELTQKELGEMLCTKANRVSDWETGRYEPGLPTLKKYAEVFSVTVAELLEGIL